MRRAVFLPLALATLAACSDSIAGPEAGAAPGPARFSTSAAAAGVFVSDARTIASNEGGVLYAQNLPFPDVGGGRVVWQDVSSGAAAVLAYDLATGTRTQYGTVSGIFAWPATAGRVPPWGGGRTPYLPHRAARSGSANGRGGGGPAQGAPPGAGGE